MKSQINTLKVNTVPVPYERALGVRLAGLVISVFLAAPAHASEPFALTEGWMSFEAFVEAAENPPPEPVAAPTQENVAEKESKPVMAAPDRPIDLSAKPAVMSQYAVPAYSTEDEKDHFIYDPKKWKSAEEMAQSEAKADYLLDIMGRDPLKIRYACLPNRNVKSVSATRITQPIVDRNDAAEKAQKADAPKPAVKVAEKDKEKEKQKQIETNKACEAYAEYRRRQLDAIESDRQTLSALQKALGELGLDQKLGFMTKLKDDASAKPEMTTAAKESVLEPSKAEP